MIIDWPLLLTLISAASCLSISPCHGQYPCPENDSKPGMAIEARDTDEQVVLNRPFCLKMNCTLTYTGNAQLHHEHQSQIVY